MSTALHHVSASGITLFKSCQTRWYHRYILGYRLPPTPAMARGTAVHTQLERFLLQGVIPDDSSEAGRIAKEGIDLLPSNKDELKIEQSLEDYPLEDTPVPFKGFIDVLGVGEELHILDHKTTSAWKWAKTEEDLRSNIQLIIYARHILEHYPEYAHVRLTHIYYLTKYPHGSKKVSVVVSRDHVYNEFEKVLSSVRDMVSLSELCIDHAAKTKRECYSYGKQCPHYDGCWHTNKQMEILPMSNKQEVILDRLRNKKEKATIQDPSAPVKSIEEVTDEKTTLYIGCRPLRGGILLIQEVLAPLMQEICDTEKVDHISFIPYAAGWDRLKFLIETRGLPLGNLYIHPSSTLLTKVGDSLFSKSDEVVCVG